MKTSDFAHRWVASSQSGRTNTLLLLHGTGGDEHDLLPLGRTLDPGANLLSPRGKILQGGMPRFFRRLAEGVFDQEDLKFRTQELASWIDAAIAEYEIDPSTLVAVGYSNGANIAASMLLSGMARFPRAVLLRAMVPFDGPVAPGSLSGNDILMLSGKRDPIIPPRNSKRLAEKLQEAGATVTLRWSESGHGLESHEIAAAKDWVSAQLAHTH